MVAIHNKHIYSRDADIYFYTYRRAMCYDGNNDDNHHATRNADVHTIGTILSECDAWYLAYKFQ